MTLVTQHAALSDVGLYRRTNEDTYVAAPPLFAVCDGMGGAEAGEVASALAAETLVARLGAGDSLLDAARAANTAVYARAGERLEESGMGTTLTAVVIEGDQARFAHVGDSRAYRLRDGRLELLSDDHSLVGEMVREGRLTWDEAAVHPHRSILSRALGTEPAVEIDEFTADLRSGDVLLLCTDGLSGEVPEAVLRDALSAATPDDAVGGLVAAAREAGGHDNITAVVIRLSADDDGEGAPAEATTQVLAAAGPADAASPAAGSEADDDAAPAAADDVAGDSAPTTADIATTGAGLAVGAPEQTPGPGDDAPAAAARRSRRRLVLLIAVLALIAALGVAGVVVVNTCYYVGVDDGRLAVYSGLPWSLGPIDLHSVYLKSSRPYYLLDPAQQSLVDERSVQTREGALRLADELGMLP